MKTTMSAADRIMLVLLVLLCAKSSSKRLGHHRAVVINGGGVFKEGVVPKIVAVASVTFLLLALAVPVAFAQSGSSIAGVVKDSSGAVLPGVTVEAASPALIEKVRTVATDAA